MTYDDFVARYKEAHRAWILGRLDRAAAVDALARLRAVVPSLEPPDQRPNAAELLRVWEAEISPEAADRMARAVTALSRAERDGGTVTERIARAEAGIAEIGRIAAEAEDARERSAIRGMSETLAKLADALRRSPR